MFSRRWSHAGVALAVLLASAISVAVTLFLAVKKVKTEVDVLTDGHEVYVGVALPKDALGPSESANYDRARWFARDMPGFEWNHYMTYPFEKHIIYVFKRAGHATN